jgi:hypothetical protein
LCFVVGCWLLVVAGLLALAGGGWRAWEVGKIENIFENKCSRNYPNDTDHDTKAFSKPNYPSQSHENKRVFTRRSWCQDSPTRPAAAFTPPAMAISRHHTHGWHPFALSCIDGYNNTEQ